MMMILGGDLNLIKSRARNLSTSTFRCGLTFIITSPALARTHFGGCRRLLRSRIGDGNKTDDLKR